MFKNIINLSSDDKDEDKVEESAKISSKLENYAIAQMKGGTFTAVKFVKFANWPFSQKQLAISTLNKVMVRANKVCEEMVDCDKKRKMKDCLSELSELDVDP
ncbi:hypothetical protein HK100_002991 [Physocladia obscura]|uniref:Uncharacterized protein n=1 Tax=Physocladia obscura TaxID=109957 RepID=A0AAD5XAP6_9FUNG|nr:hypothetical protein HK100_002991 [Physocladia obscura]